MMKGLFLNRLAHSEDYHKKQNTKNQPNQNNYNYNNNSSLGRATDFYRSKKDTPNSKLIKTHLLNLDLQIRQNRLDRKQQEDIEKNKMASIKTTEDDSIIKAGFSPPSYMTNYFSVFDDPNHYSIATRKKLQLETEYWLKKYYDTKLVSDPTQTTTPQQPFSAEDIIASRTSNGNGIDQQIPTTKDSSLSSCDAKLHNGLEFSKCSSYLDDFTTSNIDNLGKVDALTSKALTTYSSYYGNLLAATPLLDDASLKSHTMWLPTVRRNFRQFLIDAKEPESNYYSDKTTAIFNQASSVIPQRYDSFSGGTSIPSMFGKEKLPALSYHCTVSMDDNIFILGGLMAFHRYDEEIPNLDDFIVNGLENLPPPFLPEIINNPCMVSNPFLFVKSITYCSVKRQEVTGTIPPPLLGLKGTRLTPRYIFFYGGMEIITETTINSQGKYIINHSSILNNNGYILDTMLFKFSKIELVANPATPVYSNYSTLFPRLGHVLVSVGNKNEDSNNTINSNSNSNNKSTGQTSNSANSFAHFDQVSTTTSSFSLTSSNSASSKNSSTTSSTNNSDRSKKSSNSQQQSIPQLTPQQLSHQQQIFNYNLNLRNSIKQNASISNKSTINCIYIFGGYCQLDVDRYEAMNDLWRIEIPILNRGKRGYYEFPTNATATPLALNSQTITDSENIPNSTPDSRITPTIIESENDWPSARGFCAFYVPNEGISPGRSIETEVLSKLESDFSLESASVAAIGTTRPLYNHHCPNLNTTSRRSTSHHNHHRHHHSKHSKQKRNSTSKSHKRSSTPNSANNTPPHSSSNTPTSSYQSMTTLSTLSMMEQKQNLCNNPSKINLNMMLKSPNFKSYNNFDDFTKKGNINSNSGSPVDDRLAGMFIIHGGSNHLDIKGDMWWYDVDNHKWNRVQTFASIKDPKEGYKKEIGDLNDKHYVNRIRNKKESMIPLDVKLVGHSMASIGHMAVCVGGLIPKDIDMLYKNINFENYEYELQYDGVMETDVYGKQYGDEKRYGIPLGSGQLNIFNIVTGVYQDGVLLDSIVFANDHDNKGDQMKKKKKVRSNSMSSDSSNSSNSSDESVISNDDSDDISDEDGGDIYKK
ncbi:hypothetical protein TBLA_0E00730 [Henningerozyma blattae CBS 6284]|uniref:Uncharacterized protein n=1 Tax=Henningerozyma blattae (strain ATCC 34711 / CBS 6284 / DSM 70876 / NBRC 10599 / NRRL Y-10934 / UCD 77-7) TaxID=1071380 RepID=I2H432_HENB6|nr:hypothetical protein TBLA_0E00730 [Tetrapisispora blattae CBS 6284]CCH61134.1 hypothetical protein TBLA_0E00730 [Tetrapisispora blattae CBS 6284]